MSLFFLVYFLTDSVVSSLSQQNPQYDKWLSEVYINQQDVWILFIFYIIPLTCEPSRVYYPLGVSPRVYNTP